MLAQREQLGDFRFIEPLEIVINFYEPIPLYGCG
jgi:hypothetical protein